jgi:signal transduction histidine kinase
MKSRHLLRLLLSAERIELQGEPCILGMSVDITERKRAEEELHNALAREKELGELKSNFISMVSHEFRTPLGIIMSATENLENYFDRFQPAERAELLADIRTSTQRMSGLMQEVLLLARVDAGKLACKPVRLDLRTFLERLIEEVRSASEHACVIELNVAPEAITAWADEALLRHTFTNLLSNAVKYSPLGQPVRFRVERDGAAAVFSVRDHGIGIPEADQKQLFQTFHRGGNVGERPGTGLGLVIVKRCVDLHAGTLRLESQVNAGTTVTVRLPLFGEVERHLS